MASKVKKIAEGQYTATIYNLIAEQKYAEVVQILEAQLEQFPVNRAALSLLGYCYYYQQDFGNASRCYEALSRACPTVIEYKVYYAQSLYKAGKYAEAQRAAVQVDAPDFSQRMLKLQAYCKYEQGEVSATKAFIEQCAPDDPDVTITQGNLLFKAKKFDEARKTFSDALNTVGYKPSIAYNIALCYYMMKQYPQARKFIVEIIEKGIKEHPELGIGSNAEGIEVRSVGNTLTLKETALVEAFNLKAAIEYDMKNFDAAKDSLADMPPRSEEELDPITLHNIALTHMEDNPSENFPKLNFLLTVNPMPPPTFANLLLLYCKYGYYDVAADILAENAALSYTHLDPELFAFLDALIIQQTAPEEAYRKFDELAKKHIDVLRKVTKEVQDARNARDEKAIKLAIEQYDEALEKYVPVLMAQAKIYWDLENYPQVEKIFRQSLEFCSEHDVWKLNVAHVFFMQETKFKEAIRYYEPIVKKYQDNQLLQVQAIVLANLCVSYIMTSQNEEAEELMRRIEKEEERVAYSDPEKKTYHLCIVNLVIGTLYCAKQNFEFGISRIMKSLEPYNKKLDTDTWFYAKRCFVALAENLAKHMIILRDATYTDILSFFDACDQHGKNIPAYISHLPDETGAGMDNNSVSYEARRLKTVFLRLREY